MHAPCSFEMCSAEQRSQVCFQREPVKVVANGVTPNVYVLGGWVFCCGIRNSTPSYVRQRCTGVESEKAGGRWRLWRTY